ncbi:MAG: hypothetical protein M3R04_06500, partial [bacterium]|nr:hypothetical protein [bacterium]
GRTLALNDLSRRAASVLTGLGFIETQSLVLTSERDHFEKLRRPVTEPRVTLANPISVDQTMLREHLYSGLLELLSSNTDQPLPQKVFEVGDVVRFCRGEDLPRPRAGQVPAPTTEEPTERRQIAGVICATRTGYADGRGILDALLHELGYAETEISYATDGNPSALPGRAAAISNAASEHIGELFEVHPEVLELWRLENPVVAFSLTLGQVQYS